MRRRHVAAWLATGQQRTEGWVADSGSRLGMEIPFVRASGSRRAWVPQGLALDPQTGHLLQSYYARTRLGYRSWLAVLDPSQGRIVNVVRLGGPGRTPHHAGGVAVDGERVYVTDKGWLHTYRRADVRRGRWWPIRQVHAPQRVEGGSYAAMHADRLYLGDFAGALLFTYERDGQRWRRVGDPIVTPPEGQGVVVRDQEFVFSASRGQHHAAYLVVQPRSSREGQAGSKTRHYRLPNMAEGVVEVGGELITTYESGAACFVRPFRGLRDGEPVQGRPETMWPLARLTHTPLSALGLE
ncbi:MAG: hypothetical protein QM597_00135 [Aeromicrobium sp.]|uniref:hypothetical protein n=1 Tax=Aeromicrobium sp. TaxID=1871063 RepID=UPI0039E4317F